MKAPVFMSSLLQAPLAQQVIAPEQVVGILAAQAGYLDDHHLESAGVRLGSNTLVSGVLDGGLSEGVRPSVDQRPAHGSTWRRL